jgi:hypothetical protein
MAHAKCLLSGKRGKQNLAREKTRRFIDKELPFSITKPPAPSLSEIDDDRGCALQTFYHVQFSCRY